MVLPKLPYCRVMSRLYETGVISCVRHTDNSSPYEAVDRHFCNFFPPCDRDLRIVSDSDSADCRAGAPPPPAPPLPEPLPAAPLPVAVATTEASEPSRPVRRPSSRPRIGLPAAPAPAPDVDAAEADEASLVAAVDCDAPPAVAVDPPMLPMLLPIIAVVGVVVEPQMPFIWSSLPNENTSAQKITTYTFLFQICGARIV